jgi:hypothetical protein
MALWYRRVEEVSTAAETLALMKKGVRKLRTMHCEQMVESMREISTPMAMKSEAETRREETISERNVARFCNHEWR